MSTPVLQRRKPGLPARMLEHRSCGHEGLNPLNLAKGQALPCHLARTYLAIQSKQEKHNKKENGPKGGQRHHGHGFWVGDEGQART